MTAPRGDRFRAWPTIPVRWSRGLRRRARRWWRRGAGINAASIEQAIQRFAAECSPFADAVDSGRRTRWSRLLLQLGEQNAAATLAAARSERAIPPASAFATADALCARLERLLARVANTFAHDHHHLPATVSHDDARAVAVVAWASRLPSAATLLDVGCGAGRFLHLLAERVPGLCLAGLDPAVGALRKLRRGVRPIAGAALALPLADDSFDAAIAIESLEHSLRPRHAIQEMLRILKPGGRLLLIDKHIGQQADCEHEFWERWFDLDEVSTWLADSAHVEQADFLPPDGRDVPPKLFCLWTATKRHEPMRQGSS